MFAHNLNVKQFYLIHRQDRTLSGASTPGQSVPGSDGNEGVFRIPQSSSISGTSPLHGLMSYTLMSCTRSVEWGDHTPSAEMQSVYSATPADHAGYPSSFEIKIVLNENYFVQPNIIIYNAVFPGLLFHLLFQFLW